MNCLNAESFLAYGYDLPMVAADAVKQLLAAAHEQKKMPPGSGRDLLDDPFARDPGYQLSQIDLHVQSLRNEAQSQCLVASRLYTADATDTQWIDNDDLDTTDDHERLDWALDVLGYDSDNVEEPRWRLGLDTRPAKPII